MQRTQHCDYFIAVRRKSHRMRDAERASHRLALLNLKVKYIRTRFTQYIIEMIVCDIYTVSLHSPTVQQPIRSLLTLFGRMRMVRVQSWYTIEMVNY